MNSSALEKAVQLPEACLSAMEEFRPYVEGSLSMNQARQLEAHLRVCAHCRSEFEESRRLFALMENTLGARSLASNFDARAEQMLKETPPDAEAPSRESDRRPAAVAAEAPEDYFLEEVSSEPGVFERFGSIFSGAPWWGVSVAMHVLAIALAGLVSMAVELPKTDESVVMVTELQPPPKIDLKDEDKPKNKLSALDAKHETPPTDPKSTDPSDIVVPPDIMAKAVVGDHFETINVDRPDTQSAFGNPDAHMFHSTTGNDEPEGGGGMGGTGLDELIGVGGNAGKGSGGGWGGGHGTGVGLGTGAGRGAFGQRLGGGRKLMVRRHGGSPASESAVDRGLEWLVRNQEADGSWNHAKHGGGHGGIMGDSAMTGYALLAFLGAGHTEKTGKYREVVQRGVKWLMEKQNKAGRWSGSNYADGIATMALGEAAGMSRFPETLKAAQRAVDAVDAAQNQTGGPSDREAWDYGPNGGTNDSSVMAWNVLALKSCKVAGLQVSHFAFEGAINWINAGQDLGGLKPGDPIPTSEWEGGPMAYRGTCKAGPRGGGSPATMAAAGLCRMMFGGARAEDAGVAGPCNIILKRHLPKAYPMNMYFTYYATFLMFQKGGDHWKTWNKAMQPALVEGQIKGGNDDGSWDPEGGSDKGRVMSTALCILCLEVYYRYAKMAGGDGK